MALLEVIEFLDESGKQIIHRVPEGGSGEIRLGSQLVVRESQTAVFFRDGKALDVLGAGRHTLTTANIPLLVGLIKLPFGSKSPFRAEVVFVNMREFVDMKWGTQQMVTFRDKDFGMVRLRAFGTYAIQVSEPQLFVNKIAGTQGIYTTDRLEDYLRGILIARFSDILGTSGTSVLDLPSMYDELGGAVRTKTTDDFAAMGLVLKAFYVGAISVPEEVEKAIDERASMGAIGDMNAYLRFKSARAIGDAAQQPGGAGGALVGGLVGLGGGMALGGAVAGQVTQSWQQPPQAPAGEDPLKQLESLHSQGILTDEEFEAKKQQILARSQPQSVPERLKQLKALLDQGLISAEEYEAKRKELLSQL
jgi:membrane protease subunit (stomatin/prohibitin family)